MFDVRYQGLRIEVTLSASRELLHEDLDMDDVAEILERGYDCGTGKRKEGVIERCMVRGNKVMKVVVAKTSVVYPDGFHEDVWRVIHAGRFTYSAKHGFGRDENET